MCRRFAFALSTVMIVAASWEVCAGDWPTYQADAARTGYTVENLPAALSLAWTFESRQTENYGGIRPGCWVNAIPAGGLLLMADAASWCTCSYLNQATIALQPSIR
jgi:hypothetical protein